MLATRAVLQELHVPEADVDIHLFERALLRRHWRMWHRRHSKELTFERTLRLWLPFAAPPATVLLHAHERIELRELRGHGKLLLHARDVVGAVLLDTAARLDARLDESLDVRRVLAPPPRTTLAFSAQPTRPVAWDLLGQPRPEADRGLDALFVVVASFKRGDRVLQPPRAPQRHPLPCISYGRDTEHSRLTDVVHPSAATRPAPATAPCVANCPSIPLQYRKLAA